MRPSTPPPTIPALDLPRYLGTWYEIARLPMRHEPADYTDITAHYALDADGSLQVRNRALDGDGELQESIGRATVPDPAHPARLKVTFLPQGLRWLPFGKGDYWILELDEAYRTALVGSPDYEYLWLLHRAPHLDAPTRDRFLDRARRLGYALDDLIETPHTGRDTAA